MALTNDDISFTFSGGSTNADPNKSLGGDPSAQPIINLTLFADVTEAETKNGVIDYRCFYVNNDSNVNSLYDAQILVGYTVPGDVTVRLGFSFQNERQSITITNASSITSGSFTITYTDINEHEVVVNWNSTLSTWANNLQTALRSILNLGEVTISSITSGTTVIFEIDFVGTAANRFHETIALTSNDLVSTPATTIGIIKEVAGSPINAIADIIDVDTTTPNNVVFTSSPASVGDIRPLDVIPVWVQRIVPQNTAAIENDGFTLTINGSALAS